MKYILFSLMSMLVNQAIAQKDSLANNFKEIRFNIHGGTSLDYPNHFSLYLNTENQRAILRLGTEAVSDKGAKLSRGTYHCDKIGAKEFKKILNLVSQLDFPYDYNAIGGGDGLGSSVAFTRVLYQNNDILEIIDYGVKGKPDILKQLYQIFMKLRFNQNWEKNKYD